MGKQDLSTYTAVDIPADRLALSTNLAQMTAVDDDENVYAYKDFTSGYFNGDFSHSFTVNLTVDSGSTPILLVWGLSNSIANLMDNGSSGTYASLMVFLYGQAIYLRETQPGGNIYSASPLYLPLNTPRYFRVSRVESVGTYGTAYLHVYTDPGFTELFGTVSLALHAKDDYRYHYVVCSQTVGTPGVAITCGVSDVSMDAYPYALSEIITRVRDLINEDSAVFWTDAEITRYITDVEKEIALGGLACPKIEDGITPTGATLTHTTSTLLDKTVMEDYLGGMRVDGFKVNHVEFVDVGAGTNLGAEKLSNGSFATDTVWVKAGNWTISAGMARIASSGTSENNLTQNLSAGSLGAKKYRVTFLVSGWQSGGIRLYLGGVYGNKAFIGNGVFSEIITGNGSNQQVVLITADMDTTLNVEWVSVREWTEPPAARGMFAIFSSLFGHWPGLPSTPSNWYQKRSEVMVEPTPQGVYVLNAFTYTIPLLEMSSLPDTPSILPAFHPLLVLGTLAKCAEKERRVADAQVYYAMLEQEMEFTRNLIVEQIPDILAATNYSDFHEVT